MGTDELMYGHYYLTHMRPLMPLSYGLPGINRDPVRFNSLSAQPYGLQVTQQLFPTPNPPLMKDYLLDRFK